MPPGGTRTGQPQTAYPRRSDLNAGTQPVKSAKSVVQGDRKRREDAQSVMPLPATGARAQGPPRPGSLTPLTAPTERPGEPVTAGLPMGPGPGPDSLPIPGGNDALFDLRALAAAYPQYSNLYRIIALAEENM